MRAMAMLLVFFMGLTAAFPAWSQESIENSAVLPAPLQKVGIEQRLDENIPLELAFTDEGGNSVQLKDYFGKKPVILAFVYYECPALCTLVLNGLLRTLRALSFSIGREFEVVTVSFDPGETAELAKVKKQAYVDSYHRPGASEAWHFLTGTESSIRRLTKAVGFNYVYDAKTDEFAHASAIMVLTPKGKIARYFYGIEYSVRDLKWALMEASQNRIGSLVDQVMIFCFHYDPTSGKYGFAIMNTLRVAGLLTVLLLGGFIFLMLRREHVS
jgi:protein SCO1